MPTLTFPRPRPVPLACLVLAVWLLAPGLAAQTTGELYGHVLTRPPQGEPIYIVGARLVLASKTDAGIRFETLSDDSGAYSLPGLAPGAYTLTAGLEGYEDATREVEIEAGALLEVTLELTLEPVREAVEVTGEQPGLRPDQTSSQSEIKAATLENAPLVNDRFQDALPLVPGVVRGPDGLLKIKGARSAQTGWLVNSTNVTDPVTGEPAINLPSDVVQEVEVLANPYDAEYGKFSGAVTSVETRPGGDKWSYSLQNFLPRRRRREGHTRGIEAATPRVSFGGPLLKGRLSLLQAFQYRFVRTPVTSLPPLERDTDLESFDSFTQFDLTLNPNHRLTLVGSLYPQKNRFANLNTFTPQEAAANTRQRGWMVGVQDRLVFPNQSLLESTVSLKEFDVDIFPARPGLPMRFRPERVLGSFFNSQNRITRRTEWLEVYHFAPRQARGQHLLKLGGGVSRNLFRGFHESRTVRIERADGTLAEQIDFTGPTAIERNQTEYSLWLQDKWNPVRRLTLDLGLRGDYDTLSRDPHAAPRVGFALLLTSDNRTLLRGGAGLFYDKVPLNVGTFEQVQRRVVTRADTLGAPLGPPRVFANRTREIENPRSLAFNLELDRELAPGLLLRLGYLQREGRREYLLHPFDSLAGAPTLLLEPGGRSRYREAQLTLNYHFREDSFLNFSYVHSQAAGNLNHFQEFFGDFENPILRGDERSRQRFDAPDRVLLWGEVKLWWGIRWSPVLDLHSGFPFSRLDETQNFVGARNQGGRLPVFASFDSALWKDFKLKFRGKKRRVRLGVRLFNLFKHFNPRDVQQNLDATDALGLYNSRGRLLRGRFSLEY